MDRLLEIAGQARALRDPAAIEALTVEVDALAMDVVRYARAREPDTRTMSAASVAIDTARATIADCRARAAGDGGRTGRAVRLHGAGGA